MLGKGEKQRKREKNKMVRYTEGKVRREKEEETFSKVIIESRKSTQHYYKIFRCPPIFLLQFSLFIFFSRLPPPCISSLTFMSPLRAFLDFSFSFLFFFHSPPPLYSYAFFFLFFKILHLLFHFPQLLFRLHFSFFANVHPMHSSRATQASVNE